MADGARVAHRWIKQVAPGVDAKGLAVQSQEQADLVAKKWHDLWKVGRAYRIDFGGVNSGPVVPSLLTTCSTRTPATGSDNLHPALHLKHVCENALRVIAMIMTLAANIGFCPAVFATIIMVLLPKATGGWRPIGLFTSVLRVYLRWTRRAVTSSWKRGFTNPYWFGQTAHACQHATSKFSMTGNSPLRWVSPPPRPSLTFLKRSITSSDLERINTSDNTCSLTSHQQLCVSTVLLDAEHTTLSSSARYIASREEDAPFFERDHSCHAHRRRSRFCGNSGFV